MDALIKKGLRLFQNSSKMRVNIVSMDALIKKGLRRMTTGVRRSAPCFDGRPDQEGIKTLPEQFEDEGKYRLDGSPDQEGIKTDDHRSPAVCALFRWTP